MNQFDVIQVMGVGQRKKGVSKTGNAYDFVPVHICYTPTARDRVTGTAVAVVNVDTETFTRISPAPGEEFTVCLGPGANFSVAVTHWISRGRVDLDLL